MKPRVLVLASTFPANDKDRGPRFILDFCTHLSEAYDITVLTQHRPGSRVSEKIQDLDIIRFRYAPEFLERLSEHGGITTTLRHKPWLWVVVPGFLLSLVFKIARLTREHPYSLIHAHWIIPQGLAAYLATTVFRIRIPFLCTGHGADIYALNGGIASRIKRRIYRSASGITVVSQAMASHIVSEDDTLAAKVSVIPMGTDIERAFVPSNSPRTKGQMLFVGRLVEKKGLQYLIRELPSILKNNSDLNLLVAGDGPYKDELTDLVDSLDISQHVRFAGSLSQYEVKILYQQAEFAIFPFVRASDGDMEGLGLVMVEAMACRCPVIAGDVPAIGDVVQHETTGLVCRPREAGSMARQIQRLRSDDALTRKIVDNAFQLVKSNFGWKTTASRFRDLYENLASHSRLN